jgi:hypothetical protein
MFTTDELAAMSREQRIPIMHRLSWVLKDNPNPDRPPLTGPRLMLVHDRPLVHLKMSSSLFVTNINCSPFGACRGDVCVEQPERISMKIINLNGFIF